MAVGLRWDTVSPQLRLVLKAALFGVALFVMRGNSGFLGTLIFFGVSIILYISPAFRSGYVLPSFITLLVLARSAVYSLSLVSFSVLLPVFAFLFYLVLAIKDLSLLYRSWWHFILILSLLYGVFLLFFAHYTFYPIALFILLFIAVFFLWREYTRVSAAEAALFTFLLIEVVVVLALLPLGFLNSAGLALVLSFALGDLFTRARAHTLTPQAVLTDVTIIVLFALILLGTTEWTV